MSSSGRPLSRALRGMAWVWFDLGLFIVRSFVVRGLTLVGWIVVAVAIVLCTPFRAGSSFCSGDLRLFSLLMSLGRH